MFGWVKWNTYKLFVYLTHRGDIGKPEIKVEITDLFRRYQEFTEKHRAIYYNVLFNRSAIPNQDHKYVGGTLYQDKIVFTPNMSENLLIIDKLSTYLVGNLPKGNYKWTGEAVYKDCIYFFSRLSSNLLVFDGERINEIKGFDYGREHHYGGILSNSDIIQPPRSSSHFLIWNLDNKTATKLHICPEIISQYFRYDCTILHPNGFVYFFPENGYIIKMNPNNFKFKFIGNWVDRMIFDAKILPDGNIYGFTTNRGGIIKFNIETEKVEYLFEDLSIESYGTKLGINGKLYSIPGSGSYVWEYDYRTNSIRKLHNLNDYRYAKYAGGCTDKNGIIWGTPSFADNIIKLVPNNDVLIPDELYKTFWVDCY